MQVNPGKRFSQEDLQYICEAWLARLVDAVKLSDFDAFAGCLQHDGWFRDLMTFSWEFKSLHGQDEVKAYLEHSLEKAEILDVRLDESYSPRIGHFGPTRTVVDAALNFETARALGKGFVRICLPGEEDSRSPEAFALFMMISDWKGHEELVQEVSQGVHLPSGIMNDKGPDVVIVGAGQAGLQVAARLQQMHISAILVEKTSRVGDSWRRHYPTLTLHTPKMFNTLLYQPYPTNAPKFFPKDWLASWLEQYAKVQGLSVWTDSFLEHSPTYDEVDGKWDLVVNKKGKHIRLRPSHVVIATSIHGKPNLPLIPGSDAFQGQILHSTAYEGGQVFSGKSLIVVGTGNTAADICQDLVSNGAKEVLMLQRSASAVVSDKYYDSRISPLYRDDSDINYVDLASFAMPIESLRTLMKETQDSRLRFDKELREELDKAGFVLNDGPDGSGHLLLIYERAGGYFVDVGCGSLITNGRVKVKHGSEICRFTTHGVVFSDGTEVEVDAVVFATGWTSIRYDLEMTFEKEMIDRTMKIWGIDESGELCAGYRPSGQNGLWYAFGSFNIARFYSKQLALYIKAIELGYLVRK
ncbi:dimethylaniline monooxygenase [Schizopora paradoxa]|uniref:Dimethylaniline monooxygenase n=1 Tax=Schizopora paradoxa TaxID=27342 RepID=A0A0H2RYE0_9AGAM|nr:dimethylaniline monooxygenase [Schizopora paradoxa]